MSSRKGEIEVIARGFLCDKRGRVLLCRNVKNGYSFLPGGHVDFGESATLALKREFLEECGLRAKVGQLLLCHEQRFHDGKVRRHELNLVFHVEQVRHTAEVKSREDHIDFDWIGRSSLSRVELFPKVMKKYLRRWLSKPPVASPWEAT